MGSHSQEIVYVNGLTAAQVEAIARVIPLPMDLRTNLKGGRIVSCGNDGSVCIESRPHVDEGLPIHRNSVEVSPKRGVADKSTVTTDGIPNAKVFDMAVQYVTYKKNTKKQARQFIGAIKCGHPLTADMEAIRKILGLKACNK